MKFGKKSAWEQIPQSARTGLMTVGGLVAATVVNAVVSAVRERRQPGSDSGADSK